MKVFFRVLKTIAVLGAVTWVVSVTLTIVRAWELVASAPKAPEDKIQVVRGFGEFLEKVDSEKLNELAMGKNSQAPSPIAIESKSVDPKSDATFHLTDSYLNQPEIEPLAADLRKQIGSDVSNAVIAIMVANRVQETASGSDLKTAGMIMVEMRSNPEKMISEIHFAMRRMGSLQEHSGHRQLLFEIVSQLAKTPGVGPEGQRLKEEMEAMVTQASEQN